MDTSAQDRKYAQAPFVEPMPYGYIYLGWRIEPPARVPFVRASRPRAETVEHCRDLVGELENLTEVVATTVYEAVFLPPVAGSPRFDVMVLIQTTDPESIPAVEATEAYRQLDADFAMPARNIRRIGDVDAPPRSGPFLFNHFTAQDSQAAVRTFENIAGWFTFKAQARDSALLQPIGESRYVFVNHVRLPCGPLRFLLRFAKPSFRKYVAAVLNANQIANAPVFCKPV
ncbi:hypothetical protein F4561_005668 [Lipingzhangella halophila]|uniref:Uncharacterized protein n=1 Tax=Lipingzhangella halophila TaxID=1783352 RepID=A0A7W7RMM7_9ACTN|nr:hypothetical protein [Lipingzhangella halophila]MBB4934774.1 hypothetical protein [Lipingzhangella halophila]